MKGLLKFVTISVLECVCINDSKAMCSDQCNNYEGGRITVQDAKRYLEVQNNSLDTTINYVNNIKNGNSKLKCNCDEVLSLIEQQRRSINQVDIWLGGRSDREIINADYYLRDIINREEEIRQKMYSLGRRKN